MAKRLWDYPIITKVRKAIRERTPGYIPPLSEETLRW